MNRPHIEAWLALPDATRLNIFTETGNRVGLPAFAVEKDWWVVQTLALVFTMPCAPALVFKGGTSLSKAWNIIQRFSEDVDLALDRSYLGFDGNLSATQIRKLRKASNAFLTQQFVPELQMAFNKSGLTDVTVKYRKTTNHDQDPVVIEVYHPTLTEKETYLKPGVLVEVGSRALHEPNTERPITSFVGETFADSAFADIPVPIAAVNPERTFLEKIFLLHELFQQPQEKQQVNRLSRHLYDIEKLNQSPFEEKALTDLALYQTIVAHREQYNRLPGIDYSKHQPQHIAFIPPAQQLKAWQADYQQMQENMIQGSSLAFDDLIAQLTNLQTRINQQL